MHQLLNDPLDLEWVRSVHLRNLNPPEFASFEIIGNEDSPREIRLFQTPDPTIFDSPVALYAENRTGVLEKCKESVS